MRNFRWIVGIGAALGLVGQAPAQFCPQYEEMPAVVAAFTTSQSTLTGAIASMDTALSTQLQYHSDRVIGAIAILASQKAVGANQVVQALANATQSTADAIKSLQGYSRTKAARLDYSDWFGQGYRPCTVQPERMLITNRAAALDEERRVRSQSEVWNAPGKYGNRAAAINPMVTEHWDFCTPDQVTSGLCPSVGEYPGADLTVATMFEPTMENEPLYRAKVAFVNNIMGLPDQALPAGAEKQASSQAYAQAKAQKDAVLSPALATFKDLQLTSSGVQTAHGGNSTPLSVQFEAQVKRYAGNAPEYDAWVKVLSAQRQRGVMIEYLKVKALDLAIQQEQYRQYERMEAQLAALVALEVRTGGASEKAERAAESARRQDMARKVN